MTVAGPQLDLRQDLKSSEHPLMFQVAIWVTVVLSIALLIFVNWGYPHLKQKANQQYQQQVAQSQQVLEQAHAQVEQYQKQILLMREQIHHYTADRIQLKRELEQENLEKIELWRTIKTMEELLGKNLTPRVMRVNKQFRYVVINQGLRQQFKMGDRLSVERYGKVIGKVDIDKLYDDFSAAAIIEESKQFPIQEGDVIRKTSR